MWYGYRLNDQKDWVKMKTFESLDEYNEYIDKKHIQNSMCTNYEVDLRGKALIKWQENH